MTDDTNANDTTPKTPSYIAYQVREQAEGQSYFNRVGAAFEHKDGEGHTIHVDAMPIDGRIVLRTPKERLNDLQTGQTSTQKTQDQEQEL